VSERLVLPYPMKEWVVPYVPRHLLSTSAMIAFIRTEPIEELLKYFVPTESDRKYLARCLIDSGPSHHRGANFVLLSLLAKVLQQLPQSVLSPSQSGFLLTSPRRQRKDTIHSAWLPASSIFSMMRTNSASQQWLIASWMVPHNTRLRMH
jgi:hypothetical protein